MRPKMSGKPFVWGDKTSMAVTSSNPRELPQAWKAPAEQQLGRASQAQQKLPGWTAPAFTLLSEVLWKSGIGGQHPPPAAPLVQGSCSRLLLLHRPLEQGRATLSLCCWSNTCDSTDPTPASGTFKVLKYAFEERPLPGARREGQTHRAAASSRKPPCSISAQAVGQAVLQGWPRGGLMGGEPKPSAERAGEPRLRAGARRAALADRLRLSSGGRLGKGFQQRVKAAPRQVLECASQEKGLRNFQCGVPSRAAGSVRFLHLRLLRVVSRARESWNSRSRSD